MDSAYRYLTALLLVDVALQLTLAALGSSARTETRARVTT
jgi:hypothetical protein